MANDRVEAPCKMGLNAEIMREAGAHVRVEECTTVNANDPEALNLKRAFAEVD